jgi:zinc and cadmium transporter
MNIFFLLLFTTLTALLSISGGILLILGKGKVINTIQKFGPLIAFVVLLYAVFGDIIPEILEEGELSVSLLIILVTAGFLSAALIGLLMGRFHHHNDIHHHPHTEKALKSRSQAYTMLAVDSVHAIADGIVLGTSFIASLPTGISTCLATIAHEIPQEVGDFSIMQRAKFKTKKIIKCQLLSSLIIVPAALSSYLLGNELLESLPSVLAVVAGFLLYIAFGELTCTLEIFKKPNSK